jgi:hypothetical protein
LNEKPSANTLSFFSDIYINLIGYVIINFLGCND